MLLNLSNIYFLQALFFTFPQSSRLQTLSWAYSVWTFRTYQTFWVENKTHAFSCIFSAYRSYSMRSHPNLYFQFVSICKFCSVRLAWKSLKQSFCDVLSLIFPLLSSWVKTLSIIGSFGVTALFILPDFFFLTFILTCMVKMTEISYFELIPSIPCKFCSWLSLAKGFPPASPLLSALYCKTS